LARISKDPRKRKAEILEAAQRLFAERGFEATRVSDIVKAVGVSQGVFYLYFKSKEDVLETVIDENAEKYYAKVEAIMTNKRLDAVGKIERFFAAMQKAGKEGGRFVEEMHTAKHKEYQDRMARRFAARYMSLISGLVQEGIDEGLFDAPDPDAAAALFLVLPGLFSHVDEEMPFMSDWSPKRWLAAYREMAYRVLGYKGADR
jgi:AcrR family transcriptional regulator